MNTIRTARATDLPVLWTMAVLPHCGATADSSVPIPLPAAGAPPVEFPDLADPAGSLSEAGGSLLVAEAAGHLAGMAGFRTTGYPARAEVVHVRVHPALRRRGIGRSLMEAVETEAAHRGFTEAWLDTATNMPEAMAFYEGIGYVEIGRETRPEWQWTLVYYLKRLTP